MGNTFFYSLLTCMGLFILALVLKLCSVLTWSWWWITAPLWVPASLIFIVLLIDAAMVYWILKRK